MSNLPAICRKSVYLLGAVLFLYSCSPSPENNKKTDTAAPKETPYEVYTVEIKGMRFVPDSITVKKGDRIVFVNRDIVTHCVTEEGSHAWTSSAIPAGEAYMLAVNASSNYYCAIHQVMKGKIILKE
jgi:plastocyanin